MAPDRELTGASAPSEEERAEATGAGEPSQATGEPSEPGRKAGEMELPLHARNRAAEIVKSPEKLRKMVEEARAKADGAGGSSNPIAGVIEDLQTLFEMLRAVARGSYRLRKETLILIAGAVLYFVIPIDVIPDFIPVAGFIDDAAVIAWVVKTCKTEIDLFRRLTADDDPPEPEVAPPATAS